MADFTRRFDLLMEHKQWSWKHYRTLITDLRERVRDPAVKPHHSLPVLYPQDDSRPRFFDLVLLTQPRRGTRLRIRRDNLYLVGFARDNDPYNPAEPAGLHWFEFHQGRGSHYIPGSQPLRFGDSYTALENAARQQRTQIALGKPQLISAAETLSNESASNQERARAILVVVQMICEAMRFKYIRKHISSEVYRHFESVGMTPDPKCLDLETMWARHSQMIVSQPGGPGRRVREAEIGTAIQDLGLLLRGDYDVLPRKS